MNNQTSDEKEQAERITRKSTHYAVVDGELYRQVPLK
jgi:hypothetical protein